MAYLSGVDTAQYVDDIVHLDTQQANVGLDLTVAKVFRLTGGGRLDFGGSEFEAASREELESTLADPDDKYGWWTLEEGSYILQYNESVDLERGRDTAALIEPLDRLLQAGLYHSTRHVTEPQDPLEMLVAVGTTGGHLKENCRVSRLLVSR